MRSRIFQLSTERLPKDEWIDEISISDADMGYYGIDYYGETETYEEDLKHLAEILPKEVFKVEGNKITILSDGSCLFEQYKKELLEMVQEMDFNSFLNTAPFKIKEKAKKIIPTDYLFYIQDWGGYLETSNALIEYAANAVREGKPKELYINGILYYHT